MSVQSKEVRAAAVRVLHELGAEDLIPVLGLDRPRRGRGSRHSGCDVDGCGGMHWARGLCGRHYYQQYRAQRRAEGRIGTHGAHGYGLGCRCETCVADKRRHWERSNERRKAGAR